MARIRRLSEEVIDRIAAGEVVERPASVVKELLENSLDAGARRITIRLAQGGKNRIVVEDDGEGMSPEDARLALERHATSKLRKSEDLERIGTFGFRGEALSSIAAVSRFRLVTAAGDAPGVEIRVVGGAVEPARETAAARGTRIEVERLFHNVPARRKFLRADGTELAHVVRLVTRAALARPDVRFRLEHGEQTLLDLPAAESFERRLEGIFGRDRARRMLPFELDAGAVRVHGFAGRPSAALPRRDSQHLFVNGRVVQDRTLQHAIHAAYAETMPKGRHPALVLFVECDPAVVDVNVHPQKTEVRFRDSRQVHETVRRAIRSALSSERAVPRLEELRPEEGEAPHAPGGIGDATLAYLARRAAGRPAEAVAEPAAPVARSWLDATPDGEEAASGRARAAMALGQYRESYIIAQDDEGVLLVDQHAAHERVLFERYLRDADADEVETQTLMFPLTLEFAPDEHALLLAEQAEFRRIGFVFEPFGGTTVRLTEIPAVAGGTDPETLIRELLGEAETARSATRDNAALRRRLITTAACQAAIKVHYPLHRSAMQRLLDDLFVVENPTTCPHGRPALFRLSQEEIERAFRRR